MSRFLSLPRAIIRDIAGLRFVAPPKGEATSNHAHSSRMGWFVGLWFGGVVVVAVVAEGLKFIIFGHHH